MLKVSDDRGTGLVDGSTFNHDAMSEARDVRKHGTRRGMITNDQNREKIFQKFPVIFPVLREMPRPEGDGQLRDRMISNFGIAVLVQVPLMLVPRPI